MASVEIANLQIKIKNEASGAATEVKSLAEALKELRDSTKGTRLNAVAKNLENLGKSDMSGITKLKNALTEALAPAKSLADAMEKISKASGGISKASSAVSKTTQTVQNMQSAASANMTTNVGTDKSGSAETVSGLQKSISYTEKFKSAMSTAGSTALNVGKEMAKAFGSLIPTSISRTVSQFYRLAKMRILRTIVRELLQGFTEGLQNCYYWAKATGDQFATSMDTIKTSMNYAKNSIGAAFSTVLNAVAPVIDKLVDILVTGINYVNMFFAVLQGQSTYTKAKKVAVEYGTAVQNAAGGAAGAVKELKEALTVLDFDELHQLQEAAQPSSGGGGGGGGGGNATNYNDMFEKAEIEKNWLTDTANFLKDNFDDILDVVKTIGAAILLWKFSNAFLNGISSLTGLSAKQNLGLTIAITSVVFSYAGGKDIGKNGWGSLKGIIETAIGYIGAAAGMSLAFKSGTVGLLLAIPITLAAFSIGFAQGEAERLKSELDKESEIWRKAGENIQASVENIQGARQLYTDTLNSWETNVTDTETKFAIGESLLSMFRELSEKGNLNDVDLTKLQGIADAFNNLDLTDTELVFENLDGVIQSNIDQIEKLLEEYKKLALVEGYYQFIKEAATNLAGENVRLAEAETRRDENLALVQESFGNLQSMYPGLTSDMFLQYYLDVAEAARASKSGEITMDTLQKAYEASGYSYGLNLNDDESAQQVLETFRAITAWVESDDEVSQIKDYIEAIEGQITLAVEGIWGIQNEIAMNKAIDSVTKGANGVVAGADAIIAAQGNAQTTSINPISPHTLSPSRVTVTSSGLSEAEDATKDLIIAFQGLSGAEQKAEQQTYDTNNQLVEYGGHLYNITGQMGGFSYWTKELSSYGLKDMGNAAEKSGKQVSGIKVAIQDVGKTDVNGVFSGVSNAFSRQSWQTIGKNTQKQIATPINNMPNAVNSSNIFSRINTSMGNAVKNTAFSNNGATIANAVESGASSNYNSLSVVASYLSGMKTAVSSTSFSAPGATMATGVQSGASSNFSASKLAKDYQSGIINQTKALSYAEPGAKIAKDIYSGVYNGFSSKELMYGIYNGLANAEYSMKFSNIGRAIAQDIKTGIGYGLQGSQLGLALNVNGKTQTVTGRVTSAYLYAMGGWPETGSLFFAGENGNAEMVGTIGGRTGVANSDQIASAIAMALRPMLSGGGTATTNVNVQLDSATIAKASLKGQRAMNRTYNVSARA